MAQTSNAQLQEEEEEEEEIYDVRRLIDYDCHKVDNSPENKDINEGEFDSSYGPKIYVMKYLVDWDGYNSSWWSWEARHMLSDEYEFEEDIQLIQREQPDRETHEQVLRQCAEKNAKLKAEFKALQAEAGKGKEKAKKK